MVWHNKGGWKRMDVISIGRKWFKAKYIGKNRYLTLPVKTIDSFIRKVKEDG